jgi:hypothetical protein
MRINPENVSESFPLRQLRTIWCDCLRTLLRACAQIMELLNQRRRGGQDEALPRKSIFFDRDRDWELDLLSLRCCTHSELRLLTSGKAGIHGQHGFHPSAILDDYLKPWRERAQESLASLAVGRMVMI